MDEIDFKYLEKSLWIDQLQTTKSTACLRGIPVSQNWFCLNIWDSTYMSQHVYLTDPPYKTKIS